MVTGGTLAVGSDAILGNTAGVITLAGGTLEATGTFSSARTFSLSGTGGSISVDSGATFTSTGNISGVGLTKAGAGTLILSGLTSGYNGGVVINAGSVKLGVANALASSIVTLNVNSGLDLNGAAAATIAGLAGNGSLNLGVPTLSLIRLRVDTFPPDQLPPDLAATPAVKPGSN